MAEEKKKRRGRRAYLDDFQKNAAGEYVYLGKTYAWTAPRGRTLRKLWLCAGAAAAAAVAAGCLSGTAMEQRAWVLLPYVAALVSACVLVWKVYRLTEGGDPVREYVWKAAVTGLPVCAVLTSVFAAATILAELVNVLLPRFPGKTWAAILFIGLEGVALAAPLLLRSVVLRLKWT